MTAKKTTGQRLDESRAKKNKTILQYQLENGYLEEALEWARSRYIETLQHLDDALEGIRNLRFVIALLIVGWGLSVGVLLAVLR